MTDEVEGVQEQGRQSLIALSPWPVYFPASYRTQQRLKDFSIDLPPNITMVDPIGYRELLALL